MIDNTAGIGGGIGIFIGRARLTLTGCTISGNSATGSGAFSDTQNGGGISNFGGDVMMTNCTLSDNVAGDLGDAIFSQSSFVDGRITGKVTLRNSTVDNNSAGETAGIATESEADSRLVSLVNTIISDSSCSHPVVDDGNNLQWPGASCGATIPSIDPMLDPAGIADNGGPTPTIALLPGSPAIDAGAAQICANPLVNGVDQRGYVRPRVGSTTCSIGAYEYDSPGPAPSCVGDCNGDGEVAINELVTLVNIGVGIAEVAVCEAGDGNLDGEISIGETLTAVGYALEGCPPDSLAQGCVDSGGGLTTGLCCMSASDFPDTCLIGAYGCPPDGSHAVRLCDCGPGDCFNGRECVVDLAG